MSSKENLKAAFAGESQANRKYLAFSEKAEKDGFQQVAKLFKAAATAETIHALAHLRAMGGIQSTEENLKEAVEGERYEFQDMYPGFLNQAQAEGDKKAEATFGYALEAERIHHQLYAKALEAVQSGKDLESMSIYLCPVCGNLEIGETPDKLPGDKFQEIQ